MEVVVARQPVRRCHTASVIDCPEAVERLRAAARTIAPAWDAHLLQWHGEPAGFYNDVSVIAHHVVGLLGKGEVHEVRAVFAAVEQMLSNRLSDAAQDVLVVGFLEDVQNVTSHSDSPTGSSAFVPLLGPATRAAWSKLHDSWGSRDT
jgi:hypothetical protein